MSSRAPQRTGLGLINVGEQPRQDVEHGQPDPTPPRFCADGAVRIVVRRRTPATSYGNPHAPSMASTSISLGPRDGSLNTPKSPAWATSTMQLAARRRDLGHPAYWRRCRTSPSSSKWLLETTSSRERAGRGGRDQFGTRYRFVREFWNTYTEQAVHFARIAQEEGVRMYSLGTETDRLFRTRSGGDYWTNETSVRS